MTGRKTRPKVYDLQNKVIHAARYDLERKGIIEEGKSLDMCRHLAGKINLGIESISRLSITQRSKLIDLLIEMGAAVRNPKIYAADLAAESGGKVAGYRLVRESQLRMLDALAAQVGWREPDGYARLAYKVIKAPRPRNSKEVTTLRLALQSILDQQRARAAQTPVDFPPAPGL